MKLILAESPVIQRPLTDINPTTNTNESEQDIIVANGNDYKQYFFFFFLLREVCNECSNIILRMTYYQY
jgi:hypothetical protein